MPTADPATKAAITDPAGAGKRQQHAGDERHQVAGAAQPDGLDDEAHRHQLGEHGRLDQDEPVRLEDAADADRDLQVVALLEQDVGWQQTGKGEQAEADELRAELHDAGDRDDQERPRDDAEECFLIHALGEADGGKGGQCQELRQGVDVRLAHQAGGLGAVPGDARQHHRDQHQVRQQSAAMQHEDAAQQAVDQQRQADRPPDRELLARRTVWRTAAAPANRRGWRR